MKTRIVYLPPHRLKAISSPEAQHSASQRNDKAPYLFTIHQLEVESRTDTVIALVDGRECLHTDSDAHPLILSQLLLLPHRCLCLLSASNNRATVSVFPPWMGLLSNRAVELRCNHDLHSRSRSQIESELGSVPLSLIVDKKINCIGRVASFRSLTISLANFQFPSIFSLSNLAVSQCWCLWELVVVFCSLAW